MKRKRFSVEQIVAVLKQAEAVMQVAGNSLGFGRADSALPTSGAQPFNSWFSQIQLISPQQLYYKFNSSPGKVSLFMQLSGYSI